MGRPPNYEITDEQASVIAELVVENAVDLLDDAKTLLRAGRPLRATVLAAIAVEELGKLPLLAGIERYREDGRLSRLWWTLFRKHNAKAALSAHMAASPGTRESLPEDIFLEAGNEIARVKNLALYVDIYGGRVSAPSQLQDQADRVMKIMSVAKKILSNYAALKSAHARRSASSPTT